MMRLLNKTKHAVLAEDIRVAETLSEKAKGLLGKEKPEALYFRTRFGIHTFGMKFPIDCAVLDDSFAVRAVRTRMHSNGTFFWNPRFSHVIELPEGTLLHTGTAIGDILALE